MLYEAAQSIMQIVNALFFYPLTHHKSETVFDVAKICAVQQQKNDNFYLYKKS